MFIIIICILNYKDIYGYDIVAAINEWSDGHKEFGNGPWQYGIESSVSYLFSSISEEG